MPELPEVRVVSKFLNENIKGKTIKDIDIFYQRMMSEDLKQKLINQKIEEIKTHGKYIIINLTDYHLISHLRMEGKYFIRSGKVFDKHDHIIFYIDDLILAYNDTRKFGTFDLILKDQLYEELPLKKLGKEPFDIDPAYFYKEVKKRRSPIKTLLLRQELIAGIGNIYADEILFMAKVHPTKLGVNITKKQAEEIIYYAKDILNKAIKSGGTTISSFESDGHVGWFSLKLNVHTKYNEPCKVCGTLIDKMKIGGRTSYFCKKCQRK